MIFLSTFPTGIPGWGFDGMDGVRVRTKEAWPWSFIHCVQGKLALAERARARQRAAIPNEGGTVVPFPHVITDYMANV